MLRARPASTDTDDTGTEEQSSQRKSRKRRRVKSSAAVEASDQPLRRGRGKLRQLSTEIPLDVLFEIFSYLEPLDLLRMSRTTKRLRTLFMSKETTFVWERARLGMADLPPMIDGFSEPQYANLLFDSHCHNCLKTPIKYIQWQIRMRLCKECLEKGTIMATMDQLRPHGFTASFKSHQLLAITPYFGHSQKTVLISCYDVSTYERLVEESRALHHRSLQFRVWLAKKEKEHKAFVKSCEEYQNWVTSRTETRAAELDSLRRRRLKSIITGLKEDRWDEELELRSTMEMLQGHALVKQPRIEVRLFLSLWETIKPTLTELMSNLRADRKIQGAISERTRILERLGNTFFAAWPETPHNPPASSLCLYRPFFDIIKNTPPDEDATSKLKEALDSETVSSICVDWREEQEQCLTAMLRSKKGRSADLSLVVNAFTCVKCCQTKGPILHYPHFSSHPCFYSTSPRINTLKRDVYSRCQSFVRMCGLDPDTATTEDMDAADVFFRCESCYARTWQPIAGMKPVRLMRWRTAMHHSEWHSIRKVTCVDDAELLALGRAEERAVLEDDLRRCEAFVCVHCDVAETSAAARADHLRSVHGIGGEPKAVDHYRRSLKYTHVHELSVEVSPRYVRMKTSSLEGK
ncbi:hypothetical protein BDZ89DRAFT_1076413 [Hymenopellis radicata]|nr:hypothetical protein BDZ89DRAFT_1076413 [Hymenopellis radicata]